MILHVWGLTYDVGISLTDNFELKIVRLNYMLYNEVGRTSQCSQAREAIENIALESIVLLNGSLLRADSNKI